VKLSLQWENSKYCITCVFVCVCVCFCSLKYPACNAHAPYFLLWPASLYNIFPHYLIKRTISERNFDVLLTVHLSIFIFVINQLDAQNFCFTVSFISCLYMFRAPCAHHQEVKILLHNLWYHHTYMCDDTRGCVIQF